MDCKQCEEELTAFLDGELSTADSERIRSHLQSCARCAEEMRSLQEVGSLVEAHGRRLEPRPESWNLIKARICQESPESAGRTWLPRRWVFAMTALGLLAAFIFGYAEYAQIRQKNLDRYIGQYVRERESRQIRDNPYAYNPFMDVKATVSENPFRSEDR